MSVHKAGRYRNVIQQFGLLHLDQEQKAGSHFGFVAEYDNTSTTTYTGLVRHTDGYFYCFDGLTDNPFAPDLGGLPGDSVNTAGAGFTRAAMRLGTVESSGNVLASSGSVRGGNVELSGNQVVSTTGNLSLLPNGSSSLYLGAAGNAVYLPSAGPSTAYEAATKKYVDDIAQGLSTKQECQYKSVSDLANLAGGVVVAGSGPTKTITRGVNGAISGDSAAFDGGSLTLGMRVLVTEQGSGTGSAVDNGIYTVTDVGSAGTPWVLTRAPDANSNTNSNHGDFVFVVQGSAYISTGWVLSGPSPFDMDVTDQNWIQFSQAGTLDGVQLDPSGYNVFKNKTGTDLNFRSLKMTNTTGVTNALEATTNTNDITLNFDSTKITAVGALSSGSIVSGFGGITTGNTIEGATLQTTSSLFSVTGSNITLAGTSGNNLLTLTPNLANALTVTDGTNNYMTFQTTTGAQKVLMEQILQLNQGTLLFNAASGSNLLSVPDNLADALNLKDSTGQSYIQVVSTTGDKHLVVDVPATFNEDVTVNNLTVNGDFNLTGGLVMNVAEVSANTTLDNTYNIINVTTSTSNIVITLPDATLNKGREYKVAKVDTASGTVVVTPATGDSLDGIANDTLVLEFKADHTSIISHGAVGWMVY